MESLTEEMREELHKMFPPEFFEHPLSKKFLENESYVLELFEKPKHEHILVTPLVEVFSVSISNHYFDDRTPYEIYGSIQVIDGEGATFSLYNRDGDIPETVCNGDRLTLVMEKGRAITPSNVVTLKIDLKTRIRDGEEEFVNDCRWWDYKTMNDFDKVKKDMIIGARGSAVIDYVLYRHAIFITVEVILLKEKDNENCKSAHVYGSIVAYCGNNYSTILLDKKQNESVVMEYGACIELSRHVVVVPTWSSVTIHANLWNGDTKQQIVDKGNEFPVFHYGKFETKIEGQNGHIQVNVEWSNAYTQPPLERKETKVEEASAGENINIMLPLAKKSKVIPDQQSFPALSYRNLLSNVRKRCITEVLEVFSVSVYSTSEEELNLWGSINVYRNPLGGEFFPMFNRDKTLPEKLLPNQTLPITFPAECIASPSFKVDLDLKDVDGRVISFGDVYWSDRLFDVPISWFNKLLCSVVQGDDGCYAVVHYSIFSAAVKATVKIYLIDKNSSMKDTKVDGCVRTQYKDYTYVTPYDKEFYRRKLFVRHIEDPSLQYSNSKILLSESVVAVAENSALIVDVNLKVISQLMGSSGEVKIDDMMQASDTFEQQLEFRPDMVSKLEMIKRTSHEIAVSVKWCEVI